MYARLALLIVTLGTVFCHGQATVVFNASPGRIAYYDYGRGAVVPWPVGNPSVIPGYGKLNIALYAAPLGTEVIRGGPSGVPDLSGWTRMHPTINAIGPLPGTVATVVCSIGSVVPPGVSMQCIMVAWTGDYSSFSEALQGVGMGMVGWVGSCENGGMLGWRQKTGTANPPSLEWLTPGAFEGLILGPLDWQDDVPAVLKAEAGNGFVRLSWIPGAPSWTHWTYRIRRWTNPFDLTMLLSTADTEYTDTSVVNDVTYSYRVDLCDYFGVWLNIVSATPHGPPTLAALLGPGGNGLTLTWPQWGTQFRAYSATNLAAPVWTPVTNAVSTNEGSLRLSVDTSAAVREFFRLQSP